ncbi:MAG TPA: radical SAM/SPASM domain-containing protein, partial [Thermoanaerobaculia bacterium]|nr:radical SAM/SPASM domain-containing protein [Thermoanaerobaculia bacterium]
MALSHIEIDEPAPASSEPRAPRPAALHSWSFVEEARKREIIEAICGAGSGAAVPPGPIHAELDLTDRCNVACYFCNQMDVRTKEALSFEHLERLVDELAAGGLRSVRLSGGGDPLMYPDIVRALDLFAERGITVDNLTTNAALMGHEVRERLVRHGAREVVVSLNAFDARDYSRMMRVAPKVFDRVLENVRDLVALRGGRPFPAVTVQFLIDRDTYRRLPGMAALGRSLGADRVAVNPVLEIPNDRLAGAPLLAAGDRQLARPYLRRALEADTEGLLHLSFPWEPWNELVAELRAELRGDPKRPFPVAASFRADLDHCFFGWYSATIRGTGEMYPCCMLMSPDYQPIGDLGRGSFAEQWRGKGFTKLREEMREVFLRNGRIEAERFETLRPQCVKAGQCGLKSMHFRADEAFYRELGGALELARERELGWRGGWRGVLRSAEIWAYRVRWGIRTRWDGLRRRWHRFQLRSLPGSVRGAKVHVGLHPRTPAGPLDGWALVGPRGETWPHRTLWVGEPIPYRRSRAIHVDRVLEALLPEHARDFLGRVREALAEDGVARIVATNPERAGGPEAASGEPMARWSAEELEAELLSAGFAEIEHLQYGLSPR